MSKPHNTKYSIHLGGIKMYRDSRQTFQWSNMKRDTVQFVDKCLTSWKKKAKHQWPVGELKPLDIPMWRWDSTSIKCVIGLPLTAFSIKEKMPFW